MNTTSPLTAHEVCNVLTDVALGKRIMTRSSTQSWSEIYHGLMPVEIDCWQLTLFNDCDTLDYCEYCEYCRSPDGRVGTLELWQRDGAEAVDLSSTWERGGLERLLAALVARTNFYMSGRPIRSTTAFASIQGLEPAR
ncbi:DUF7693 family protein [Pseudomonas silesiensis]|uniref:DUF7693 family protein n=1 Tax=Pseudomonas silesiensis TaxID=1853130 RepID=UPI003B84AAC1